MGKWWFNGIWCWFNGIYNYDWVNLITTSTNDLTGMMVNVRWIIPQMALICLNSGEWIIRIDPDIWSFPKIGLPNWPWDPKILQWLGWFKGIFGGAPMLGKPHVERTSLCGLYKCVWKLHGSNQKNKDWGLLYIFCLEVQPTKMVTKMWYDSGYIHIHLG